MIRGDEDIEGRGRWGRKFFDTQNGGSEKKNVGLGGGGGSENFVYFKTDRRGGGAPKKIELLVRGAAKISIFEFQYLHPPPCHVK